MANETARTPLIARSDRWFGLRPFVVAEPAASEAPDA